MFTLTYWSPRPPAVHIAYALVPQTEYRTRLGAFRHGVAGLAVDGGNGDLVAQHRLGEGDGDLAPNVEAVTLEQRVGPHCDGNCHIAGRAVVDALVTLTAHQESLAVVDTGRDIDLQLPADADTALAAALLTGVLDDLALTAAVRTGADSLHHTKGGALLDGYLAGAMAVGTGFHSRTLLGAGASTVGADLQALDGDGFLAALWPPP